MKAIKPILILACVLVIAKVVLLLFSSLTTSVMLDFSTYFEAVKRVNEGLNPYSKIGTYWFTYPPTSLPFFGIFSVMPLFWAQIIWTVISLTALVVSIYLLIQLNFKKISWSILIIVFGLALLTFPMRFNLLLGQVNNFILLFLVLTIYFSQKGKSCWAGFFLGISVLIKVFPIFMFLTLFSRKKPIVILASLSTILLGVLFSVFFFGLPLNLTYLQTILPQAFGALGKEVYYNQALSGFIARLPYFSTELKYAFYILSAGAIFILYLLGLRRMKNLLLAFSLSVVTLLLLNGYTFFHHVVLLVIPYVILWPVVVKASSKVKALYLLSYILLVFNIISFEKWQNPILVFWLSHDLYSLLILFGLHFVV